MTQHQIKAFTLAELIVVITILAILGTIAFISLQGYSKSARDSTRVSDVNTIESSLELFSLQSGYYPEPSNNIDVTFSGGQVWTQGTVGNGVSSLVQRLNKKPTDPLTGTEYTYSRLNTKGEIEVSAVLEDSDLSQVSNTYAGDKLGSAYVTGNYNGVVAKVSTGSNLYVLAVPTIISGDISLTDYTNLIDQGELVFNGGDVLPASYDGSTFKTDTTSITGMSTGSIVIYNSGSSLPSNQAELDTFIANLQTAYSGSSLADSGNIAAIVNETNSNNLTVLAESIIEQNLGGEIIATSNNSEVLTGWRAIDSNCSIEDVTIGIQTWAGCNSTLGTGFEWGKRDNGTNGTIGSCYNYNGANNASDSDCSIGNTNMESNVNAKNFFDLKLPGGTNVLGDSEFNTNWGKFYTWSNSSSACPTGRSVPTDAQWAVLENTLNGSSCRSGNGNQCTGLGWSTHNAKTDTNNLANALKLPLVGYRILDGSTFYNRGLTVSLWSSTPSGGSDAFHRLLEWNMSSVARLANSQNEGYSVRCIKD